MGAMVMPYGVAGCRSVKVTWLLSVRTIVASFESLLISNNSTVYIKLLYVSPPEYQNNKNNKIIAKKQLLSY